MSTIVPRRISQARSEYNKSSARLKRARRLYKRFVYRSIIKSPDMAYLCAQRAMARCLYAESATIWVVSFSLTRGAYKNWLKDNGLTSHDFTWHSWIHKFGDNHRLWDMRKRVLVSKPRLRIVA